MPDQDHPVVRARKVIDQAVRELGEIMPSLGEAVPTGWVLVAEHEYATNDSRYEGGRALTVMSSDATGESDLPPYTVAGWMTHIGTNHHEYLYLEDEETDDDHEDD